MRGLSVEQQNNVVTQNQTYRSAPDVSFDADPNTGVAICDSYDFGSVDAVDGGRRDQRGGTLPVGIDRHRRPGKGDQRT